VTEAIIISVVDDAHSHVFPFVIRSVIGKMHMLLNGLAPHASLFPRILLPQDINNEFITWIFYYNSGFLLSMLMLREMHLLREITLSFQCLMNMVLYIMIIVGSFINCFCSSFISCFG